LHSKFLSDGERRARNVGPAGFLDRFNDAGEAALRGATSRLSSVRLEQAFRLSERVVEAVGINRDRIAEHVVSRRLGHLDIQTTQNLYGWVSEDAEQRTVAEWQQLTAMEDG
jgi:integrase